MQFQVDTAEELPAKLRICMDRDDSIIYVGFSFSSKRPYYGLAEARTPHERWAEHWRSIRQHHTGLPTTRDEKYAYMAANGGIGHWFFLPYVSCGQQIELSELQHHEQSGKQQFPNALNKCRQHMCLKRVVWSSAALDKLRCKWEFQLGAAPREAVRCRCGQSSVVLLRECRCSPRMLMHHHALP